MHKKIWLIITLSILLNVRCFPERNLEVEYSFFVAGHTYGAPGVDNAGFHPPFKKKFELINSYDSLLFGVLTGDIVKKGTEKDWNDIDDDIKALGKKVHIALGNHEYKSRDVILKRFKKTYYSFIINNDLHIILDPNLDHWNISGDQLKFLKDILNKKAKKANNIFVYFHQVLWWGPKNKCADIALNSHEDRDPNINFWTEVEPLFHNLNNQVFMFAGDVGAADWSDDYSYHFFGNIHLISSGMGEGIGDNFLIIHVLQNKKVLIDLVTLNGDYIFPIEKIKRAKSNQ